MRVVIIGGTGHVGTFLVPRLVMAGHEVNPTLVIAATLGGGVYGDLFPNFRYNHHILNGLCNRPY
jgi:hypothetical protein